MLSKNTAPSRIDELRQMGMIRCMSTANELDLLQIRNETFVHEIDFHDELESTNSTAMELAKTDCQTPLLVITPRQVAGRGRNENHWWSTDGALTFSLIIDLPVASVDEIGPYSLTVGLALCQAFERLSPVADVAVKWPNDVFLNDKKVCGILIERPIATEPRLVVGVGINVNNRIQQSPDVPDELAATAISLSDAAGEVDLSLTDVLIACLQQLEQRTRDHLHQRKELLDQWRAYCALTGRDICVDLGADRVQGKCTGISDDGALLVDAQGIVIKCVAGSVTIL